MAFVEIAGLIVVAIISAYAGMIIERRKHVKRREVAISPAEAIALPDGIYYKRLRF